MVRTDNVTMYTWSEKIFSPQGGKGEKWTGLWKRKGKINKGRKDEEREWKRGNSLHNFWRIHVNNRVGIAVIIDRDDNACS